MSGGLALLQAFCQWKIEHQLSIVFFFFCNCFHTDSLHLPHAQIRMHSDVVLLVVTVLLRVYSRHLHFHSFQGKL